MMHGRKYSYEYRCDMATYSEEHLLVEIRSSEHMLSFTSVTLGLDIKDDQEDGHPRMKWAASQVEKSTQTEEGVIVCRLDNTLPCGKEGEYLVSPVTQNKIILVGNNYITISTGPWIFGD
jgi:hypothetical protein